MPKSKPAKARQTRKERSIRVQTLIPQSAYVRLCKQAHKDDRSVSGMAALILQRALRPMNKKMLEGVTRLAHSPYS